ncbi:MAG TPA: gamma-glutamyl-gamma-aminobutyrate hydrolase family protein [Acidimicrobiales bacterium]
MKTLVIGNRDDADLGVLGAWMDARGMAVTAVDREDGRLPDLDGFSLVISMGSVWRVHDPELEPLIRPEQALLRDAVATDVPVLAICFGMQQLTVAFGGEVFDTADPEIGFRTLAPVSDAVVPRGPWMQFHYDACHLPPGAVELARNDHGLQAYRVGSALAVQFHPEVDRPVLQRWAAEGGKYLEEAGLSASWLLEQSEANVASSCAVAVELFDAFWAAR